MSNKYAVICADGTSYMIDADDESHARELVTSREEGTEVEDALDIEMPEKAQWDGTGADWLAEQAQARGLHVVRV
jgi:hypothetical protein